MISVFLLTSPLPLLSLHYIPSHRFCVPMCGCGVHEILYCDHRNYFWLIWAFNVCIIVDLAKHPVFTLLSEIQCCRSDWYYSITTCDAGDLVEIGKSYSARDMLMQLYDAFFAIDIIVHPLFFVFKLVTLLSLFWQPIGFAQKLLKQSGGKCQSFYFIFLVTDVTLVWSFGERHMYIDAFGLQVQIWTLHCSSLGIATSSPASMLSFSMMRSAAK